MIASALTPVLKVAPRSLRGRSCLPTISYEVVACVCRASPGRFTVKVRYSPFLRNGLSRSFPGRLIASRTLVPVLIVPPESRKDTGEFNWSGAGVAFFRSCMTVPVTSDSIQVPSSVRRPSTEVTRTTITTGERIVLPATSVSPGRVPSVSPPSSSHRSTTTSRSPAAASNLSTIFCPGSKRFIRAPGRIGACSTGKVGCGRTGTIGSVGCCAEEGGGTARWIASASGTPRTTSLFSTHCHSPPAPYAHERARTGGGPMTASGVHGTVSPDGELRSSGGSVTWIRPPSAPRGG